MKRFDPTVSKPPVPVSDGNSLTFVTPAHAAGAVSVTVTTATGTTDPDDLTFTYLPIVVPATPTITTLDPDNGPTAGGTSVTITGTGFTPGTTVAIDGGTAIVPTNISADGTELTFITPVHAAGEVEVTVTNSASTSAPADFTYNAPPVPAPTVTDISPNNGPAAGGTSVTITGTDFTPGTTVSVDGGPAITPDSIAADGTSLTFTTPAHDAGTVPVSVTSPTGTSGAIDFTYNAAPIPAPTTTGIAPNTGLETGGDTVTITGTNFTAGSTVSIDGGTAITPDSIAGNGQSLTFTTPAHAVGPVNVTVTTPTGTSNPQVFTYGAVPVLAPTITTIAPNNGPAAGGNTVTLSGTNFTPDTVVNVDGVPVTPTTVAPDGTSLTFTAPSHGAGTVPVSVTTPEGTSAPVDYTYNAAPVPAPTVSGIAPDHGPIAGGTTVTITGSNFTPGATVTIGGTTVPAASVASNGNSLTFVAPAHAAGDVGVSVTTPSGSTDPDDLTYTYDAAPIPAPTATSLTPDEGPVGGGTSVTITGTGFTAGSTVSVDGGAPISPTAVAGDGTSLTFTTPAHAVGAVSVTVTTASGTTDPADLEFTYVAVPIPAPTLTGITPDDGPEAGGTLVTLTGTGFVAGTTVSVDGGAAITPASISADGTTLTFVTPPHADGTVDVTVTNPSGTTSPVDFTYNPDAANPAPAPVVISPADGSTVTVGRPPISGTGDAGNTIVVTEDGDIICQTVVLGNGTWTCTPTGVLANGSHTIVVTETDGAGLQGDTTVTFTVAVPADGDGDGDGGVDGNGDGNGNGNGDGLAATGLEIGLPLTLSVNLLGAGGVLLLMLWWVRRRRTEDNS